MIPLFNISKISKNLKDISPNLIQMKALAKSLQPRVVSSIQTQKEVDDPFANLSQRPGSIWKVSVASPGIGQGSDWKPFHESGYPMLGFDYYTGLGNSNFFIPLPKDTILNIVNTFLLESDAGVNFSDFIEEKFGNDVSQILSPHFEKNYSQQGDDFILDNDGVTEVFDNDDNMLDSDYSLYFSFVKDVP